MVYTSTQRFTGMFFWIALLVFPFYVLAQNPGGVTGGVAWYKANSGVSLVGGNVAVWNDSSTSANNATQVTTANQPAYTTNAINFNQSVTLSGTNYLATPVNNLPSGAADRTVFVVAASTNTQTANGWVYGYGNSAGGQAFCVGKVLATTSLFLSGYAINSPSDTGFWIANVPKLGRVTYSIATASFFDAGSPIGTTVQGVYNTVLTPNSGRIGTFANTAAEYWSGNIAEIIAYPGVVTGTNAIKVESYLALKYGIHKAGNYVSSAGTVVWDSTINLLYDNDVFGIAQDDTSGLLQSQSNSTNTGNGSGTGQTGKGNIVINNPSSLATNGFLMVGHDVGLLTETNIVLAGKPTKRVQRIWKVQSTGNPGTVSLSYDKTGLTYSGQTASDYVLLVDPTGLGNFDGGSVVKYTATAITGNKISFDTVSLPTGAVFTFQTLAVPTAQATDIVFSGTTSTGTTASWTNGNGSARLVFVHAGSTGSPLPIDLTTYTANPTFGGGTQIGLTGWYCVYKGTGTTVNISGLIPATSYQVMTLEYNGTTPGNEIYLTTVSTDNPATITTNTNSGSSVGPGGAITGLQLWLDASNGIAASGGNLTAWTDRTAINTFAVSATPPTVNSNAINFHPTVEFNNTTPINTYPATQNLIGNTSITYVDAYAVFKVNNTSGGTVIGSTLQGNSYGRAVFSGSTSRMYAGNGNSSNFAFFPYADITNFHVFAMEKNTAATTVARLDANNQVVTNQGNYSSISFIPTIGTTNNNSNTGGWPHLNGQIAEVVAYSQSAGLQKINIESYLALKYGIHKIDNYVSSVNTIIWDATLNAIYNNDVFGIGIDDLSGLSQSISNSMNTGSGDGTGQSGKGNIIISNPTSLTNNGFLLIGHNTSALTETDIILAGNHSKRVQRIWKAQATGNPGNVTLSYDITGLSYSGQSASDYVLLVDPTGLGAFDSGSVVKYTAALLTGNKATFNAVALPTGAVFTFQTLANPTVQATNIVFSGTTATTTTASWTNGSGSSRAVFMFAGTTGSALPIDLTAYTANTVFGTGTQIGTTGWFCIYNGTGTTVNITGLTPLTTYQLMTVEYTGVLTSQLYLSTISTGNPAGVSTLNNVATLNNLTISQGTLNPAFATGTTIYTANVANAVTNLTVTPTTTDANAMVTVNGEIVISGNPSGAIALAVGPNIITTIVRAQDGITLGTYTITINRTAPATIVATGTLSALSTVYGTPSTSGTFNVSGTNMLAGILVTAPSGFEVSADNVTFTNTVTVGATGIIASTPVYIRLKATTPAGNYLGDVVLSSAGATTVNFATVSSTVNKTTLTITADNKTKVYGTVNPALTVSYSGFVNGEAAASLTTAPTIATTAVTGSAPGTYPITASLAVSSNYTFTYVAGTLTVTPLTIATLSGLAISQGTLTPVFATGTTTYTATVNNAIASLTVTPTTTDATATVKINGITVASGSPSGAINLAVGPNVITTIVTAQDGTTIQTYTITVTKAFAPPVITNFSPQTGPVGTSVIISGSNFGATIAENIVFFGAVKATVTAASSTSLTVTVPVGTTYQSISIINGATSLIGYSTQYFITTFTPNKAKITIDDLQPKVNFSGGNGINMVIIGDFDGDGKNDLVITNDANNTISVFRNTSVNGSITTDSFAPGIDFATSQTPRGISIGDFDDDGKLDLAVATFGTAFVDIFRNTSSGTGNINFTNKISYAINAGAVDVTVGDIDGDGKADVIASGYATSTISVLRNTSSGPDNINFAARADFPAATSAHGVAIGDIDSDGKMDIVTSGYGASNVSVLRNTSTVGTMSFAPQVLFAAGSSPYNVEIGDFNRDGKPDLAVSNVGNGFLSVFTNISSGAGNINFSPKIDLPTSNGCFSLAIGDIDGDGNLDLVGALTGGSVLPVFRNTSSVGGAISFSPRVDFVNNTTSRGIAIGDLDGDGKNDIITANATSNNISIFRNNPLFAPTVQATNVVFTATTGTSTTASWTNGNGSSRAVFMYAGTSGSPVPVDYTPYAANAAFGTGAQIGTSGWYCVYYGTGTTANITGLNPATTYQVMVVERNGSATDELYLSTVSTGNPAGVTTLNNISTLSNLTISQGTLDPVFSSGTTTYTANVANAITSLTVTPTTTDTNATVQVNGTTVVSGNASGAINLAVGPNVITTIVTAQDGTTISTYTITINRTAPATIVTTGTVPALSTVYGTPSASGTFNVSGTDMLAGILVTAPLGFEVSSNNTTFSNTITVGATGIIASTPVYIRLKGTIPAGNYLGDVTLTSAGATTVNFAIVSSTVNKAPLTITAVDKTKTYGVANPALTVNYAGFVNGDTVTSLTTAASSITTATTASGVGTYLIIPSGAVSSNYEFTYVNGNLTVTAGSLTFTADDKTRTYGAANPVFTGTYDGFVNGDTESSITTPPVYSTIADEASVIGDYPIIPSGAVSPNYVINYVYGNLTVTKATLTVTAENKTKVYGNANPTLTVTYSAFANGDTVASLTTPPTITTAADETSPVGTYLIIPSAAVSPNYDFTYVNGNLEVTKASLTITAENKTKVYGNANPTLTVTYSAFANGDTVASLTTPPTITTAADETSPVGTYLIIPSAAASPNYDFTYVNGNLEVTKASLTITAENKTKVYGNANPTLTITYSAFANGDTVASLTTPPTIATAADDTSAVGTYLIIPSAAASPNYDFTYVNGNLEVTKASLTITAENKTKVYGNANPALTVTYSAFANGDTVASLTTPPTITTAADDTSPVGTYLIIPSAAASPNYDFTYVNGNLEVTKASLTITAENKTKVYGSANPTLTVTYSAFANGDTVASLTTQPTITTAADDTSPVGTYLIIPSAAASPNYDFTYVNGNLEVTKAALTITAENKTKVYGSANPTLTITYSAFANGDTVASLTTQPTITTAADETSPVGTYLIIPSGAVSSNYDFTYVNGNLEVTKAALTITAENKTKVYGSANPTLTITYSAFANGDTVASLTTQPTITTVADETSSVGTYLIIPSGAVSPNYDFTYVNGNLEVTKASLTITAENKTKVYGSVNPTLTITYSAFANGDTIASLTTQPTITTVADETSSVGTYLIIPSGAVSPNYDFTYVNGNLEVTKASLTITAENKTKVYGSANPTLTVTYSAFANGDTVASLTTSPTITTAAYDTSAVGTYLIIPSAAASPNYDFTYVNGNLEVTKASLTITAENKTKVYGSANPVLTVTYSAFANGDTVASLTTQPTITTAADETSPVGTYLIIPSGAVSSNYDFTYVNGNLEVTKASLTITAENKTKVYGSANPPLTATYSGFVNSQTESDLLTLATITTTGVTSSPVGSYPIVASGASDPNYTFTYVDGSLEVTKATLTVTADNKTKVYGSANPPLTATYSGFVTSQTESDLLTLASIATTAVTASPVGTYPIVASGASDPNYIFDYVDGTLEVTKAILTVTAESKTKVYGSVNPPLTATYSGFVNSQTESDLLTLATIATTGVTASPVGTYPIVASGASDPNYTFDYVDGSLEVTKATLTVTADNQSRDYGEANPTLTATYSGFVNGDSTTSLTTLATVTTTADITSPVGTYPITASGVAAINYIFTYVLGTLTVLPLTDATLSNLSISEGTLTPVFASGTTNYTVDVANAITSITVTPVTNDTDATVTVNGVSVISGNASGAIALAVGTNVITVEVTAQDGTTIETYTITVSRTAPPTIIASGTLTALTTIYGTASTSDTFTVSGTDMLAGILVTAPSGFEVSSDGTTFTSTVTVGAAGAITATPVYIRLNGTIAAGNYSGDVVLTSTSATAVNLPISSSTITPAILTITANDATRLYGAGDPIFTTNVSGLVNGDTSTIITTPAIVNSNATAASAVGNYVLTASGAVLSSSNYTIVYVDGNLEVTPATLTITANAQTKAYGSANPALTVSYSGFVNGDTSASLTTGPTITTTADASSPVGTYDIIANGALDTNYTINYVDGILTVTPVNLIIAAVNQTKIYGEANPILTVNYTGFVNGDTETDLLTPAIASTTADATSPVGIYPITVSGATSNNYTISHTVGAVLAITPANLAIAADDKTKIYGEANPSFTFTYTGFVNGDTEASLTTPPVGATTADTSSPVGIYPITISGATSSNYTIGYTAGATLSITPANLAIAADDKSKIYGEANPSFTFTYTGFVNGDTEASLTTPPVGATTADTTSPVGIYPITISGATSSNYTIGYTAGAILAITPANLAIAADDKSKIYGEANPSFTFTYTGFINGDTEASLITLPVGATTANTTSPVGIYPITISGATSSNYTIGYTAGAILAITPANLAIAADDKTKIYGEANPPFTFTYTGFVNGDTEASLITLPVGATTADTSSPVGIYPITISGATSNNYTIGYTAGATLTVTPATLTVTADNQIRDYGQANPTLTATYTGFINGDTVASVTTLATVTTTANTTSPAGTYPITAIGALATNYTFTYVAGTLTVIPLTDATLSNLTISEGTLTPDFAPGTTNYTVEVSNAIASITITPVTNDSDATVTINGVPVISGNASGAITLAVGSNIITVLVTAQDGTTTESYTITVNRTAPPTIVTTGTLVALSTTYGTASTSNTFNVSGTDMLGGILVTAPTGFEVSTDNITFTNTVTVGAAGAIASTPVYIRLNGTIPAGSYSGDVVLTSTSATTVNLPITISTVTPATLTITAIDATRLYGAADPAFSTSVAGFVNGDTNAIITNAATVTSTATINSPIGNYVLTPAGAILSSSNYTIVYVNGNLSLTSAILTITADAQTKTYGAANPTLTVSYSGFVNGDTAANLTTAPTITTVATTTSSVGNYIITASGAVSSNYTFNYVDGNLAVTPTSLIITADNQTKVYGSPNPIFTSTYTGFVNGDTASSLTVQPVINTPAVTASPVGTYAITDSGAVNPNYTISYVSGNLTVTTAPLTITADNKTRAYGAANPPLTASYAGFVNGETVASLTTPPTIATIANATSPVGVYAITVSGAVDPNYTITYVTGVLTVTSPSDVNLASLTISNGVLTPAFSPNILLYNVNVSNTINTETITIAADDPLAKITINGNPIVSGSSFTVLSLLQGVNTFTIKVTSEDGSSTKTYILNINKEGADDASLSNLMISKGVLDPKFKSDITNYDAVVRYDVNSITVTPTATDPGATITVNGIAVTSNTASTPITLLPGENIIETVVTAEDGITKEIYAIVVYKGLSPDALVINNILSPNGDGKNDFWVIKDIELFPNNKVSVFDRAGRIVYSKNSYSNEWDGSYGGSPLNNDTYYYLIDLGEDLPKIKGFITMIRD